ncbi:MAG: hypothetical protein FWH35_03175 [Treponema sp.]|nr:hypothetical protein [Treponema sp.]
MKIPRNILLIILAALGVIMIGYGLVKHFTGIGLDEEAEKYMFNVIFIAALGFFVYNRKMIADEKKAAAAKEAEERRIANGEEPPSENDDRPHWER